MRKLIKKYQPGGGIGNFGALDLTPKIDANADTLRKQASSLRLPNTETPGNFTESGIGTNFFQKIGGWDTISAGTSVLNSLIPKVENSGGYETVDNIMGVASQLPVIGKYAGIARFAMNALNSLGASKLAEVKNDQTTMSTLAGTGGGYGDFMANWDKASQLSGKKVGLFSSKSSLNDKIYEANRQMSVLQGIIGNKQQDDLLTAQMGDRWNERTMRDMNGGFGNISFGRLGLKIEYLKHFHEWQKQPKVVETLTEFEIPEFKEGGKMNVIPEGSLHARLHHMENAEGLTKKGIPVVSEKEGGELEQQAEIELNEIIFRLEVTQELEKLMEDGSDNAAIEAGKLLVKEIFENTDDRTGLIDTLKPEEKKQTTEDVVKNHQVFKEGGNIKKSNKTIDELVEEAIKQNPFFIQRIGPDMGYAEFIDKEGKTVRGTHYLETSTDDRGRYIVSPRIQMKNGRLQDLGDKALEEAKRNKNYLVFESPEDAELFVTQYKNSKKWKPFFDIWERRYGSYKNGGIMERVNNLSIEQLDKLNEFLNGMQA